LVLVKKKILAEL